MKRRRPELYDAGLDWYLNASAAACGERSGLGAQIAQLERGGVAGEPNTDPYTDAQVGWGSTVEGAFARERRLRAAWLRLPRKTRRLLVAHYCARMPARRNGHAWAEWPPGVAGQLGELAGVVLLGALDSGRLGEVLALCERSAMADLRPFVVLGEGRCVDAHKAWRSALRGQADAWVAA